MALHAKLTGMIYYAKSLEAPSIKTIDFVRRAIALLQEFSNPRADYAAIETHLQALTDDINIFEASLSIHSPKAFSLYCRAVREKPNSTDVSDANRALTILAENPDAKQLQEALSLMGKVEKSLEST